MRWIGGNADFLPLTSLTALPVSVRMVGTRIWRWRNRSSRHQHLRSPGGFIKPRNQHAFQRLEVEVAPDHYQLEGKTHTMNPDGTVYDSSRSNPMSSAVGLSSYTVDSRTSIPSSTVV